MHFENEQNQFYSEFLKLHLKVLKNIIRGYSFGEIQTDFNSEFDSLNYLNYATGKLLSFINGKLIGAFPISPYPTQFKVNIHDIGIGYSMCAIDALGTAYTFMQPTTISTNFYDVNEKFTMSINPFKDAIEFSSTRDQLFVTYLDQRKVSNIAIQQCPVINFYRDKKNIPDGLNILNIDEALVSAKKQFSQEAIVNCVFNEKPFRDRDIINLENSCSSCNC